MQEQDNTPEPVKPNLKHDNMDYAASTDGDDILDLDTESAQEIEEEQITAEELVLLEEDDVDSRAAALNSAETDSQADEDNFLTEKDTDETPEDHSTEDEADEQEPT
ncbi:MAG: hypothetical protein WKI04_13080 [Ferruginibacter sp.]